MEVFWKVFGGKALRIIEKYFKTVIKGILILLMSYSTFEESVRTTEANLGQESTNVDIS